MRKDDPIGVLKSLIFNILEIKPNDFHPLVIITGNPLIGKYVYIGAFSEINARDANVVIGDDCDIASFVAINAADSHKKCIGLSDKIERKDIMLGNSVFVGSHSVIKGGAKIGHHSVIAAGTVVDECIVPPYSLVYGNPMKVKEGYYKKNDSSQ